ncbi:unnamed protein product [Clonostachys solani]|uniref:Major facilitator superfamily (MFS) profile domain-containing protein n=1 Tax=Clonostachys solani TaxID=160281 RepID=A0A9P0ENE1_9HYPO|nr:unnamed protein product [Clonostachys solani]
MARLNSPSSTTLEGAAESQPIEQNTKISYVRGMLDLAGVTDAVLNHHYVGQGTEESPYIVEFLPDDPWNPVGFSRSRKWLITIVQAVATLSVSFASSAFSGGISTVLTEFRVSQEVAILGVSMFVLGFAIGPLIWAPLSEIYGRQMLFFITYMALTAFEAGAAGAPNIESLVILRFLAGAFGSSPLTNAGAVIADMFKAEERGIAMGIFAMAPFLGPAIGPIAGGFLGEKHGWRWVQGMIAIFNGVLWIVSTVVYPETYSPVILKKRAKILSEKTGKAYMSKLDIGQPQMAISAQLKAALVRPWVLLFAEPIVLITSVYMAIIYGTLYLCFAAFPIVYQMGRGWSPGIGGLAFIGIAVGMTIAVAGVIFDNKRYTDTAAKHGGNPPPEARLPPGMVGSLLVPIGMFWFAWTNSSDIHWSVSIIGSGVFGSGIVLIFLSLMAYLVDTYVIYAASVLAANSVLRSVFGAVFPLFTPYMYEDLGIHWASSIPAFLAAACVPFPFLFYYYGDRIRARGKYALEAETLLNRTRSKRGDESEEGLNREEIRLERIMSNTHTV